MLQKSIEFGCYRLLYILCWTSSSEQFDEVVMQGYDEMIKDRLATGLSVIDDAELESMEARSWNAYVTFLNQLPVARRKEKGSFVMIETSKDFLAEFERLLESDRSWYPTVKGMVDVDVLKEARKNYERERARLLSDRKEGVDKAGLNPSMEDDEAMDRDLDILLGTLFRAS